MQEVQLSEREIREGFEKAKEWIRKNIPEFAPYVSEPTLEIGRFQEGWDISYSIKERKIMVNLRVVEWYLQREKRFRISPKFDIETALIHELFEYCYMRKWNCDENDRTLVKLVHLRARALENQLRKERGLRPWF